MTNHQDTSTERFEREYNRLFRGQALGTKHMADCELLWQAALASRDEAAQSSELRPVHSRCKERCQEAIWCPEGRCALAAQQPQGQALQEMEARKDAAYLERNQVVAALAKCFPSGIARTAIEGWSEDWHGCVYIDLPTGQASWHFHDSHAYMFDGLPPYQGKWDGHTTDEKYERLATLKPQGQAVSDEQIDSILWIGERATPEKLRKFARKVLALKTAGGVACVVDARIPGTYQSWLGARLALALPDDVLIDLLNKAAPNDISDKAVFSAYQEHQKTQAQQAAAVPACDYWATIAGLESSVGHLSALVDQQRDLLAEVEDIFGRDGHGGRLEDGESELIDRIRSNLEMIAAPAAPPSPVLPLSADQIRDAAKESGLDWQRGFVVDDTSNRYEDFARAIEAAHGITAKERAMGIDFDRLANLIEDAAIRYAGGCPTDFRPTAKEIASIVLYEAERAFSDHDKTGRQWVKGSLWDTLTNEGCARIRALAKGVR